VPGWAEDDVTVAVEGGTVSVRLRPPSPLEALSKRLTVSSSAAARPPR
jgi:HSP20 family molecular chaperone IbpA